MKNEALYQFTIPTDEAVKFLTNHGVSESEAKSATRPFRASAALVTLPDVDGGMFANLWVRGDFDGQTTLTYCNAEGKLHN